MQAQGIIQGIQIARGIGYIRPDDGGADLLFQRASLAAGAFEELREGESVTYELRENEGDPAFVTVEALRPLAE